MTTLDEEWAELAREIPGFAGLRVEDGRQVILTSRPNVAATIAATLATRDPTPRRRALLADYRVQVVRYDFAQLYDWWQTTDELWRQFELVQFDIDERENRLEFGVNSSDRDSVRSALLQLGIPDDAIYVYAALPTQPG